MEEPGPTRPTLLQSISMSIADKGSPRDGKLYIIYFTLFLQSFGFAIVINSLWPFLLELDPTVGKFWLCYVVAANPLGQFICLPIIGIWASRTNSITLPVITSLAVFCVACVIYGTVGVVGHGAKYLLLVARILMGVSSASEGICKNYVIQHTMTSLDETGSALRFSALAQVAGFVVGLSMQRFLAFIGGGRGVFTMYTAPAWICLILGIINLVMFSPGLLTMPEINLRNKADREIEPMMADDYVLSWCLMYAFFVLNFVFTTVESLAAPLVMDNYAYTKQKTSEFLANFFVIGAVLCCIVIYLLPRIFRRFSQIKVLVYGALVALVFSRLINIPFRPDTLQLAVAEALSEGKEKLGCPLDEQKWCDTSAKLGEPELVIGLVVSTVGYIIASILIQTLFTRVLGTRPQGVWTNLLVMVGAAAKVFGTGTVIYSYTSNNPTWLFSTTTFLMLFPFGLLFFLRVQYKEIDLKSKEGRIADCRLSRIDLLDN